MLLKKIAIRIIPTGSAIIPVILGLAGCASRLSQMPDPVAIPKQFSETGNAEIPDRWWTVFEDSQLNMLVDESLQSNLTLNAAWERLKAARAVVRREGAAMYPAADPFLAGETLDNEAGSSTEFQLGLAADYEVDLWGRIRSDVEAERYVAGASYTDYQTAALSLSAEITRIWFQLNEAHSQIVLIRNQIESNRKIVDLFKTRFRSGQIRTADILRQQQLLEATREQLIVTESRAEVLAHQLAVLLGTPPQTTRNLTYHAPKELPPLPETGIPAELVQRRPDVRTAFNQLKAADSRVAAAISDQYPRLTLSASLYTTDDDAVDLFDDWARSFGGALVGPLLDAGSRQAEVDRTQAVRDQQIYQYGQAVLTAFQEVEDALILELKQTERIASIQEQLRLAEETLSRLRHEYLNGVTEYIDVLIALTNEQQLQRDLLSAKLVLYEYRIALYRALAGGFETNREVTE